MRCGRLFISICGHDLRGLGGDITTALYLHTMTIGWSSKLHASSFKLKLQLQYSVLPG